MQANLRFTEHLNNKIQSCSKSLFALKTLKSPGMPSAELQEIFRSTTLASLLYAAPSWWGFAIAEDRSRLQSFLSRAIRAGFYPPSSPTVEEIVSRAEQTLFKSIITNPGHVLYPLLPPPSQAQQHYNLRPRAHLLTLPIKKTALTDKNYITRSLFKDCY